MSLILNIIGIFLLLSSALMMFINPMYGTILSTLMLMGNFEISFFDYNFIAKLFVLLSSVLSIVKYGIYRRAEWRPLILLLLMFIMSLFTLYYGDNSSYGFSDLMTSFSNILMGIMVFSINWDEFERKRGFKLIAWSPFIIVLLGVIRYQGLFYYGRIVSVGLFSHVPFWCGMGYMSAITLSKVYMENKYTYVALIDLAIILLTNSRGGAIFAVVLSFPFVIDIAKK